MLFVALLLMLEVVPGLGQILPGQPDKIPTVHQVFPFNRSLEELAQGGPQPRDNPTPQFIEDANKMSDMWLFDLPTPPTPPAVRKPNVDAAVAVWIGRGPQKTWKYLLFSGDKVLIYSQTDFDNISNIPEVVPIAEKFPGFPARTTVDAVTVHPSGDGIVLFKSDMVYVYGDVNNGKSRKISDMPLSTGLKYNCRGLMADLASPIDAIIDHDKDWSTCIFIKNRTVHHNLARWEKRSIVDTLAMFLKYYPISASMAIADSQIVLFSGNRFAILTVKENGGYWEKVLSVIYKVKDFREANDAYTEEKDGNH